MEHFKGKGSKAISEVPQSFYNFVWKIANFDRICGEGAKKFRRIKSPKFTTGEDIGKKSEWLVYITGIKEYVGCHLCLCPSKDNDTILPIQCSFKIGLGNPDNPFIEMQDNFDETFYEKDSWGNPVFMKISDLYAKKEDFLRDNSLQLSVQMTLHGDLTHLPPTATSVETKDQGTEKKFVSDFDNLFQSKLFTDVEVKCEKKIFHCHKAILSARSDVFSTMFSQIGMTEANSNEVTVEDMRSSVLEIILKYIYTGRVDLPSDNSVKLTEVIYGAEKYQLTELKNICFNKMLEVMTEENIGELIETSQMYNADDEVKKVIRSNCKERLLRLMDKSEFRATLFKYPEAVYDD